jgi:hypothetical protein
MTTRSYAWTSEAAIYHPPNNPHLSLLPSAPPSSAIASLASASPTILFP